MFVINRPQVKDLGKSGPSVAKVPACALRKPRKFASKKVRWKTSPIKT